MTSMTWSTIVAIYKHQLNHRVFTLFMLWSFVGSLITIPFSHIRRIDEPVAAEVLRIMHYTQSGFRLLLLVSAIITRPKNAEIGDEETAILGCDEGTSSHASAESVSLHHIETAVDGTAAEVDISNGRHETEPHGVGQETSTWRGLYTSRQQAIIA